jgi:hypothetical protein
MSQLDLDTQKVKFMAYQKPLSTVLIELSKATHVNIAFSSKDIPESLITINSEDLSFREVLEFILSGSNLIYEVVDYTIVIYKINLLKKYNYTISGKVFDLSSGELMLFADVYLRDYSKGTSTNEYGYYNINLPRGKLNLVCSYLGYEKFEQKIELNSDQRLDIYLSREPEILLDEILITADKLPSEPISFFRPEKIKLEELERMISLGGENDIIRLLYAKPGVLTGADGFGGLHIRGGDSDQNQILLDGVPIYNAEHAIGLYSIFNSDVIKTTNLLKSDFPARYGGNLSSVLDIRTRDGNKMDHHGGFDLGLFTVKAGLEGPILKNKASYLVSLRRTYADIWINSLRQYLNDLEGSTGNSAYYNYDINGKLHFNLNDKNDLFLSYFQGQDVYDYDYDFSDLINAETNVSRRERKQNFSKWDNRVMSLKWTSNLSPTVFMKNTLIYSEFDMNNFVLDWVSEQTDDVLDSYRFSERLFVSAIKDIGFQSDFDVLRTAESTFRFGFKSIYHQFNPAVRITDNQNTSPPETVDDLPDFQEMKQSTAPYNKNILENRIYVEHEQKFGQGAKMNIGLNLAHFYLDGEHSFSVEPRLTIQKKLTEQIIFQFSGTVMSQLIHQVDSKGVGFPSQVWLPSNSIIEPQKAWQVSMGLNYAPTDNLVFFIDAFYKDMNNLLIANPGEYLEVSANRNWETDLAQGIGFSYGIETGLAFKSEFSQVYANYSLLFSKRKFEDINGGKIFEDRYSRRHMVNLSWNMEITPSVNFSIAWTYGTGNPYTFPTQIASFVENGTTVTKFIYEELNNFKIPDYHRLDFEFNVYSHFVWGKQKISLGAYNVYNRKNPFYISYDNRSNNINEISNTSFKYVYVFPLIPVLNYSISF